MKKNQLIFLAKYVMKNLLYQIVAISIFACTAFADDAGAQAVLNKEFNITVNHQSLQSVIEKIGYAAEIKFIYSPEAINAKQIINLNGGKQKLRNFLDVTLKSVNISYRFFQNRILLFPVNAMGKEVIAYPLVFDGIIKGKVINDKGTPIPGVNISVKGSTKGTASDDNGDFIIQKLTTGSYTLVFSYLSYITKNIEVIVGNDDQVLNVVLSEDNLQLDGVVVTSPGNPKRKLESSVAISTLSSRQLETQAPINSADMLKSIPGLWVESSSGDGPGSIKVRGLPGGGYRYMGIMEDGLPVMPTGFSTVPSPDQYFKPDLTIKSVESIRGGNAPLIMPNTAGAVANNLSYTGADKQYSKIKFTSGLSQDLYRFDANTGGKISESIKYNIGGFYRTDKGIRPPSYTANKGGQLKANVTFALNDRSYIRVYGKYMDDKTQMLETGYYPFNNDHLAKQLNDGYDMFKQSLISSDTKFSVTLPEGNSFNYNGADGYHTKSSYGGLLASFNTENGWNIKNNFRYQYTQTDVTLQFITTPSDYKATTNYYYLDGTKLQNPTGFYTAQSLTNTKANDKQLFEYLDFTKKLGKHSLNLGGGIWMYKLESEGVGFIANTEIKNQPRRILIGSSTGNGIRSNADFAPTGHTKFDGTTTISSVYANDEFAIDDQWRIDIGGRLDFTGLNGNRATYEGSSVAAGGQGFKITGKTPFAKDLTYWSASVGVNYKINEGMATFARATRSYNAFNIQDYSATDLTPAQLKKRPIYLAEAGLKYAENNISLFSSVIYSNVNNLPFAIQVPGPTGSLIGQSTFGSARTLSFEIEASYRIVKGLSLRLVTTLQDAKFTDYAFTVNANARPDLAGKDLNWKGNTPERTPKTNIQLSANYEYKWFNAYVTAINAGDRWSTNANTYRLKGYTELNGGFGFNLSKKIEWRGWVNNLLNSRGLTEGNTRGEQFIDASQLVPGQLMIGRAILPRSFWTSISMGF